MSTLFKFNNQLAKVNADVPVMGKIFSVLVQDESTFTHLPMAANKKDLTKVEGKTFKFEDFVDQLDNSFYYSTMIQEAKQLDEAQKYTKIMMTATLSKANESNIWIDDLHDVDYEEIFYSMIKNFEL